MHAFAFRALCLAAAPALLCTFVACGGRTVSIPPGDGQDSGLPPEDSGRTLLDVQSPPDTSVLDDSPFDGGDSSLGSDTSLPPGACDYMTANPSLCSWTTVYPGNPVSCVDTSESSQQICATLCGASRDGTPADRCYVGTGDMVDCYVDTDPACGGGGGEPGGDPPPTPNGG